MSSMSSDFVMLRSPSTRILPSASLFFGQARGGSLPPWARHRSELLSGDLLLQEIPEAGASCRIGAVVLHRFRFLVRFLGLDRQRDGPHLAVHGHETCFDLVTRL